ncbi:MAG: elongation factor P 5-aminopentanone reductase [Lachnospiraceae bacterium]
MSKTILITGASRGIGRGIALFFAEKRWNLILCCHRQPNKLEEVQQMAEKLGSSCLCKVGNVGDYDFCRELIEAGIHHFGRIDVLVNNAGISWIGLLQDMDSQLWNQMVNVNLTSVFNCCQIAIPYMIKKQTGTIINISSVWGVCGASCEVAYSATKGGINAFTKALAKELAPSNIQVNAIACGAIDTEMNQFLDDEERQMLLEEIPAGRMGTTEEAAQLVYQLCTGPSYLTGQVIQLDGGWI